MKQKIITADKVKIKYSYVYQDGTNIGNTVSLFEWWHYEFNTHEQ